MFGGTGTVQLWLIEQIGSSSILTSQKSIAGSRRYALIVMIKDGVEGENSAYPKLPNKLLPGLGSGNLLSNHPLNANPWRKLMTFHINYLMQNAIYHVDVDPPIIWRLHYPPNASIGISSGNLSLYFFL